MAFSPDLGGFPVDAEVAASSPQAVGAFTDLGCIVEEVKPGFADSHDLIRCLWSAHEAGNYAQYLPRWRDRMDPGLVACIEDGLQYSMVDYVEARAQKLAYWDTVRPLFAKYDLLLTPTLSVAALPVGRLNSRALVAARVGLDPLGLVQLSVQLHRPARGVGAGRLHVGRIARRPPDRRPSLRRPDGPAGLRRVRGARARGRSAARRLTDLGDRQPGTRVKGPRVWLDLDQAELDDGLRPDRVGGESRAGRPGASRPRATPRAHGSARRGASPTARRRSRVSTLYATMRANAPINVLIHGGAWRAGLAKNYAFPAELFVRAGAHFVVPDFAAVAGRGRQA